MNIYSQIMSLYGITFLISMFVAFIIWIFSKIIDHANGESSFFHKRDKQ